MRQPLRMISSPPSCVRSRPGHQIFGFHLYQNEGNRSINQSIDRPWPHDVVVLCMSRFMCSGSRIIVCAQAAVSCMTSLLSVARNPKRLSATRVKLKRRRTDPQYNGMFDVKRCMYPLCDECQAMNEIDGSTRKWLVRRRWHAPLLFSLVQESFTHRSFCSRSFFP